MEPKYQHTRPALWGGIECSIIRNGQSYRDQLRDIGHYQRNDLEHIAALNIQAMRYPVLWEFHQPSIHTVIDWRWTETQLNYLREKNITPIAGLVHHGSGPMFTNLADKNFPFLLQAYAHQVAQKFPWLEYYCPINEPLTTARFSGLYGHWYPHSKDDQSFLTMLVQQLKGVVMAMHAIRKINPTAKLLQTEDITKVHATPTLSYQADFENHRRWLSLDLLNGRVDTMHPLWQYLLWAGLTEEDLSFFQANPCPPDVIGLNYYVTSERFLDDRIYLYDVCLHGGNGRHAYVDIEAARVVAMDGLKTLINDTWARYRTPLVVSEAHMNCTREEQLRWMHEIWSIAEQSLREGIPVHAVTAWAMLGAYDWDSLVVKNRGHYESGVFDCRNHVLRPTALAKMLSALARGEPWHHPALDQKGWWHQPERFLNEAALVPNQLRKFKPESKSKILILGSKTSLGEALCHLCEKRRLSFKVISDDEFLNGDCTRILESIEREKPWAIIHAATTVSQGAGMSASLSKDSHVNAMSILAHRCKNGGIQLLSFSSHLVFDGRKESPYVESDSVSPCNFLGDCHAAGELALLTEYPASLIVRTSTGFGPTGNNDYVHALITALEKTQYAYAFDGGLITPAYYPDVANAALDLLLDEESGVWHIANNTLVSWADFAKEIALRKGYSAASIKRVTNNTMIRDEFFSPNSALKSIKGIALPELDDALNRFFTTV